MASNKKQAELPAENVTETEQRKEQRKGKRSQVLKIVIFLLIVVLAAAVIIVVLTMPVLQASGTSMADTLQEGDVAIAHRNARYERGDIVAFYYDNTILIKRVIGVAGDWIDIDEESGQVYVNGEALVEPYVTGLAFGECNIELPYQVPDGRYFVMGDNRETSVDSRNKIVGCVDREMVAGKLILRVWPLPAFGLVR